MLLANPSQLSKLEPIAALSEGRLQELASLCFVEKVSKDIDPLRMNVVRSPQAMYLLKGDLGLRFKDGRKKILRADTTVAKYSIDAARMGLQDTIALTEIEIVRIDLDLLDIMMTWDQLAGHGRPVTDAMPPVMVQPEYGRSASEMMSDTKMFSADNIQNGLFSHLPPANIEEMFRRMTAIQALAGQVIIMQGAEGDYYYLIESGTAVVTRATGVDSAPSQLALLGAGDAFGEDALVSENKRNATVTMQTDGTLLRLKKSDFIELLKAPIINEISMAEAEEKVLAGAQWIDVRFPSEYRFDSLPHAINIPLNDIRSSIGSLDKTKQYITYCQTGRRSSAAAFILIEHGFDAVVLEGGTRGYTYS